VIDTGGGLDDDWQLPVGSGGFGLASVRERLHLLCGTTASLEGARDEAAGCTRFILRLPQRHHTTVQ